MSPKGLPKRLREIAVFVDNIEHYTYLSGQFRPIADELRAAASLLSKAAIVEKRGDRRKTARAN